MMKKLSLSMFVMATLLFASCGLFEVDCQEITGDSTTRTIGYNSFNEIKISVPARVIVSESEDQSVTFLHKVANR